MRQLKRLMKGQTWIADGLEDMQDAIEPPTPEHKDDSKSMGDRVIHMKDVIQETFTKEDSKKEEDAEPKTLGEKVEESKKFAQEKTDDARSRLADRISGAAAASKIESKRFESQRSKKPIRT